MPPKTTAFQGAGIRFTQKMDVSYVVDDFCNVFIRSQRLQTQDQIATKFQCVFIT